jgi:hypothetical protein
MSLVGSLEDLGLGDILQIVSLSRKSGLLLIHSDEGEGRIVFHEGLVRAAFLKGEAEDLRGLLVHGGFVPEADFERAEQLAEARGEPLGDMISESTGLSRERLDSLKREHVERVVFCIFSWSGGEFSFEVREEVDPRDGEILLPVGVNAQYLTMEATRIGDEDEHSDDDDNAPMFSGEDAAASLLEGDVEGTGGASDETVGQTETGGSFAEPEIAPAPPAAPPTPEASNDGAQPRGPDVVAVATAVRVASDLEPESPAAPDVHPARAEVAAPPPPECLIALDSQLGSLEWQKATASGLFGRVHIFQSLERAIERIRQYLVRGRMPVVLISATPPSDAPGLEDLMRRLKLLAPSMPILLAVEEGAERPAVADAADAVVARPAASMLDSRRAWPKVEGAATLFRDGIATWLGTLHTVEGGDARADSAPTPPVAPGDSSSPHSDAGLRRLREMSVRIRDPSRRGEVLALVLEFAAESFSRVAMFMVRDGTVIGMAQRGMDACAEKDLRAIELPASDVECFRRVLDGLTGWQGPVGAGDEALLSRLGADAPSEAYLAPIQSGGHVVALLYADNHPGAAPIGDTTILEIVLHEAGVALEHALLEHALARVDGPLEA